MDILKKLNYIMDKKQKIHIAVLAVMIFVGGLLETLGTSALLPVVWVLIDESKIENIEILQKTKNLLGIESNRAFIIALLVMLILVYVVKNIYMLLLVNEQSRFISYNRNKMISRVLREFLNRPYEFYLDADIPTVFRLTDSDIPNVFAMIMAMISLCSESIVFVLLSVVMIAINWKMTLFLVGVMGAVSLLILKVLKPRLSEIGQKNLSVQSRIAKWRIQAIYGIKDVKVLHREAFFADNYENTGKVGATIARRYSVMNSLPRLLIETLFIASVLVYVIVYIIQGNDISQMVTMLTAFAALATRLMPCVNRINTYMTEIAYQKPCLDYVYENMNINALSVESNPAFNVSSVEIKLRDKIELKDIVYAYPNTDKLIFDHAHMEVPYGKSVGIMGPSGAGKSTIVDILLGLLHVKEGTITCDGVNVFDNYPAWLAQIGYIPQSIYLVDEPIRNNIAFGIADEEIDDERIWQVLEEAQLKDFIKTLPDGLDTTIGDRGVRLSGGQRQRLGIARALYHNPEILVFDEATSALDNETEAAVMEAINSFHGKKTMVIIAHRLNTIEKCDLIYKVDEGKIVETSL